jgi:hypothetical protein
MADEVLTITDLHIKNATLSGGVLYQTIPPRAGVLGWYA